MATVKIVLRKKVNKDGTSPLAIRITENRKTSFIHLGKHVKEKDWDAASQRVKKSHPNSGHLNSFLLNELAQANNKALEIETKETVVSSKAVKEKITAIISGASFFDQANIFIANLRKIGQYNRVVSDEPRLRIFKEFLKDKDIACEEITVALLKRFRAYLKGERGVKERTVMNYFILIRTILNQAIEAKLASNENYPFGKGKITIKFSASIKIGLDKEEVKAIEEVDLSNNPGWNHARNVWLLSFYFAGVRTGDVLSLKWADFQGDRLYYSMNKNDKPDSLKISAKVLAILDQYRGRETRHDLIFPELTVADDLNDLYTVQRKTAYADKNLNKALKDVAKKAGITKPLTMHISRHSFGNISGDKIPIQMLQKLYRHTSITTTIGYQANFIHKDADEALEAVIGV